jgi:uncharacterized membrane protein
MAASVTPPPALHRSWGRIALVAALVLSLCLNAVALGALFRTNGMRDDLLGPDAAAARLPADLRQELRRALRDAGGTVRPLLREVVRARAAIVDAAHATPYQRDRAEAAMVQFRASVDALLVEVQGRFLDRLDARAREQGQ